MHNTTFSELILLLIQLSPEYALSELKSNIDKEWTQFVDKVEWVKRRVDFSKLDCAFPIQSDQLPRRFINHR